MRTAVEDYSVRTGVGLRCEDCGVRTIVGVLQCEDCSVRTGVRTVV